MMTIHRVTIFRNEVPAIAWAWLSSKISDHHPEFIILIEESTMHQQFKCRTWELEAFKAALEKIADYDQESIWSDDRDDAADAMLSLARVALGREEE